MSDAAIQIERLSKAYRLTRAVGHTRYRTLREDLVAVPSRLWNRLRQHDTGRETFWALKDVTLDINEGDVVGVIGRNGAGKSTLLKILARITEPTRGRAEIFGRVGSLLEVGTGFHPELTGRENIYLSGAVLGMTRRDVNQKFDAIVAFAEVEKFLDMPAKHYSSGMYVRLAFAVAAHLEPEILLVDEVLAVGDAAFQNKCLGKMGEVAREGRTVVFVSHNMGAVLQLCSRAIVLASGECVYDGNTSVAVSTYLGGESRGSRTDFQVEPDRDVQILSMSIVSPEGSTLNACPHTNPFAVRIEYAVREWPADSYLCLDVFNENDTRLLWSSDVDRVDQMVNKRPSGTYRSDVTIPGMVLAPGRYYFSAAVYAPGRSQLSELKDKVLSVDISDGGSLLSNFGIRPHSATMIPLKWNTERLPG
ncbi:MAG: ABC transporter ATP-binding protein [Chloroflexi bacterium]|nr:ABC transporter ATP-binding protein [Chloroflexota bacterium]